VIKLFFIFIFLINTTLADEESICRFFKYCNGSGTRSSRSAPSSGASASLNPANISHVKGFGIESVYQAHNPVGFNVVTGNGKIGALVSPTLENSFFGNRSIEIDEVMYERMEQKIQYDNKKFNFALGAKLIEKNDIGIDIGFSVKRNPDIKNLNWGGGLSLRYLALNFGAYFYQDDVKIDLEDYINPYNYRYYSSIYQSSTYQEKFSVATYTVGAKLKDVSLDFGVIKTRYKFYTESTSIYVYSSSYSYNKFLFNLAIRKESSNNLQYVDHSIIKNRDKFNVYYGAQYLLNQNVVVGLQYNNFLLNELSAMLTIFF
jgi:hypothetical protein